MPIRHSILWAALIIAVAAISEAAGLGNAVQWAIVAGLSGAAFASLPRRGRTCGQG
ncbi:hypothetical protein H8M03_06660 [Sphingomonas sabuli]|uniref:Uncharacterized protein n=1 Tax=Sphingomonas sabuli TaxID=2764186 RepID=A0A7G9KZF2_9SPHN|nr:hypothetical protein [Sphingomonas sabuli]QNM81751.1 hypothetical protein H8M03_06660 [Sphingomonas sabuli]